MCQSQESLGFHQSHSWISISPFVTMIYSSFHVVPTHSLFLVFTLQLEKVLYLPANAVKRPPGLWMQSIRLSHSNRPALLRCYINRVTSPSLQPHFLGAPNSRRLMSTRNFVPCFLLPRLDPPCSFKTLALAQRGPVSCVTKRHLLSTTAPATPYIYNLTP